MNTNIVKIKSEYPNGSTKHIDKLKVFTWLLILFWSLLICGVLAIAISFSFKSSVEIFQNPWSLPTSLKTLARNYNKALFTSQMSVYLFNSIVIVSASLIITLLVSSMAAYVLTRFSFRGRKVLIGLLILGMGIPLQLMIIPQYKLLSSLTLADTYLGMVIIYATVCIPFTVFVLTGFFSSIPSDILEAATMDGSSQNRIFWMISMPLAKPGLIAVTSFNFVWIWNEYLLALVFTSKKSLRTISLGMYALQGSMTYTVDWGALFAGVVIMVVPAAIIFVLLNKYIISGVTVGAVKG